MTFVVDICVACNFGVRVRRSNAQDILHRSRHGGLRPFVLLFHGGVLLLESLPANAPHPWMPWASLRTLPAWVRIRRQHSQESSRVPRQPGLLVQLQESSQLRRRRNTARGFAPWLWAGTWKSPQTPLWWSAPRARQVGSRRRTHPRRRPPAVGCRRIPRTRCVPDATGPCSAGAIGLSRARRCRGVFLLAEVLGAASATQRGGPVSARSIVCNYFPVGLSRRKTLRSGNCT